MPVEQNFWEKHKKEIIVIVSIVLIVVSMIVFVIITNNNSSSITIVPPANTILDNRILPTTTLRPTTMVPTTTIRPTTREPAFITLRLEGNVNQNTIKLKFSSRSNSSDISWNISNQEFTVQPDSYIYIGGSKNPLIPGATNLSSINNPIKYELRDFSLQPLSSSSIQFVSILMIDNNYVIRPNVSGNDLYYKTGNMGYWNFTIMAS